MSEDSFWSKAIAEVSAHDKFVIKNWYKGFTERPIQTLVVGPLCFLLWSNFFTAFAYQTFRIWFWYLFKERLGIKKPQTPHSHLMDAALIALADGKDRLEEQSHLSLIRDRLDGHEHTEVIEFFFDFIFRFLLGLVFLVVVFLFGGAWLFATHWTGDHIWKPLGFTLISSLSSALPSI